MEPLLGIGILSAMYFLPSIIAALRGHASVMAIIAVNALFGWTFLGWIWAFIWSLSNKGGNNINNIIVSNNLSDK